MNQYLLDTCVLILCRSRKMSAEVDEVLGFLKTHDYFITPESIYEFTRGVKDLNEFNQKLFFLQFFPTLQKSNNDSILAAHYYNAISKLEKSTGGRFYNMKQFSDSDIWIGASSLSKHLIVFTFDRGDFPSPFFEERAVHKLSSGVKLYLLEPDFEAFAREVRRLGIDLAKA